MASSQGLTFLSGAAIVAALGFYSPLQNPAVEPYVLCSVVFFFLILTFTRRRTGRLYNIFVGYGITRGFIATTIQLGGFLTVRVTTLYNTFSVCSAFLPSIQFISAPSEAFWMPFHLVASKGLFVFCLVNFKTHLYLLLSNSIH